MSSMLVLVGSMPCVAPLVSFRLGSCNSSPSTSNTLDTGSYSLASRVLVSRRVPRIGKRWNFMSCKYQLTTAGFAIEQGSSVSLDSNATKLIAGGNGTNDDGPVLKSSLKPVLESSFGLGTVRNTKKCVDEQERTELIQSLDVVLEKAEKLEALGGTISVSSSKDNKLVDKSIPSNTNCNSASTKHMDTSVVTTRKIKTLKSVWRKGDSRASVQRVVQRVPKSSNKAVKEEAIIGDGSELKPQTSVSVRPAPPYLRPEHKLQEKPYVVSPPIKKPVILKGVGTDSKSPILKDGFSAAKSKDQHPILVDQFSRKKPVVDPVIAQAELAPTKPKRSPAPGKFKGHKKFVAPRGPRRQIHDDDVQIPEQDTSELSLSIPVAARKGRKWSKASRKAARLQAAKNAAPVRVEILEVGEKGMLIEELAYNLAISEGDILGYLYSKGMKPDGVQTLDKDIVKMICKEHQVDVIDAVPVFQEMAKKKEILDEDDLNKLENRPPVITIMGHVDHGKTTLLDYIRKTKVAASEAGGITQAIGAYKVLVPVDGKKQPCIFLDTPGHEAFGAMRARGARVTDIALIVVAADDGIRPQTNEAIAHAKAAGVPIVIAINKIDKDGANPESVIHELSSIGLLPEDWGGDIPMVQTSALQGKNIDDLLETVMLVAELQELKANPHRNAKGTVIEAGLHKSRGPVATFIVQNGTLRRGDVVVCGQAFGKMRALFDDGGKQIDQVGPSMPVQVMGLSNVPSAGDEFEVVTSLDVAREKAEARAEALRNDRISAKAGDGKVTLSSLASAVSAGRLPGLDLHRLNIILKVDVQGSVEAVRQALQVLPQDNVTLKFLLQATGDVSTSDVDLAVASDAIILGFNVKASGSSKSYAENKGVEMRLYKVIYELVTDVRNAMEGLLEPVEDKAKIGSAEVRAVFSSGSGRVAGCMVVEGRVVKGCGIRVIRKRKELHVGVLDSLRKVKERVKEVNAGLECGIGVEDYSDWEEGDIVEAFDPVQKKRTLEEASASMAAALQGLGIEL